MSPRCFFALLAVLALTTGGCGKALPSLVDVNGTITLNGVGVDEVRVEFMPDPEKGTFGPASVGESDSLGQFRLSVHGTAGNNGAVIGWHRVVLMDFKALNSRDTPINPRFDTIFGMAATTPIFLELKADQTEYKIELSDFIK